MIVYILCEYSVKYPHNDRSQNQKNDAEASFFYGLYGFSVKISSIIRTPIRKPRVKESRVSSA